jgi:transketolase
VREVDGHDVDALTQVMKENEGSGGRPRVVIARTTFGKGVSYMEGQIKWHYYPMSEQEYTAALEEIGKSA